MKHVFVHAQMWTVGTNVFSLIPSTGIKDGNGCQVWTGVSQVTDTYLDFLHQFPPKMQHTDSALVPAVCTVCVIMSIHYVFLHTRTHSGKQTQK